LLWLSLVALAAALLSIPAAGWAIGSLGRRPVRSFKAAAERVGPTTSAPLGLRPVPVARVVGSVGRWRELATDFRPLRWRWDKVDDERYRGIAAALRRGLTLPPIVAYLLDGDYYVLDGHHRVAAARAQGQLFIDAEVTEYRRVAPLVLLSFGGDQPADAVACGPDCLAAA
jgi:hypothetical protein